MTARRLLTLHVGTPKSGTTYLQGLMARNREVLRSAGVLYPGQRNSHFLEALGLREAGFRGHQYDRAPGAWEQAVQDIREHPGGAVLSHESFGGSRKRLIERIVETFPDHEIRVVITCRDLGRQLPASWQEKVKNGRTTPYEEFLDDAIARWKGVPSGEGVWRSQNIAMMGRRWAEVMGGDQLRFVTVPQPGAGPEVLWERFRIAAELPDAEYRLRLRVRNPSLGATETELLRRLTDRLPEDLPWPEHSRKIKLGFAERGPLTAHQAGGPLTVPADRRAAVDRISTAMVRAIRSAGYPVIGDLDELAPSYRDDGRSADEVPDSELLDRALTLMATLLLRDPAPAPQEAPADSPTAPSA